MVMEDWMAYLHGLEKCLGLCISKIWLNMWIAKLTIISRGHIYRVELFQDESIQKLNPKYLCFWARILSLGWGVGRKLHALLGQVKFFSILTKPHWLILTWKECLKPHQSEVCTFPHHLSVDSHWISDALLLLNICQTVVPLCFQIMPIKKLSSCWRGIVLNYYCG